MQLTGTRMGRNCGFTPPKGKRVTSQVTAAGEAGHKKYNSHTIPSQRLTAMLFSKGELILSRTQNASLVCVYMCAALWCGQCCCRTCLEYPDLLLAVLFFKVILCSSRGRARQCRDKGLDHLLHRQVVSQTGAAAGCHCSTCEQPEGAEPR